MQVLVSELVDRVLTSIDMEDGYVTPAMVVRWLNVVHPRFLFMLQSAGWVNRTRQFDFSADGSSEYALPTQAMSIAGVFEILDDGSPNPLRSEDGLSPLHPTDSEARGLRFRVYDSDGVTSVALNPPQSSGNYSVLYFQHPLTLVTENPVANVSTDSVNYPNGWEEWLVCEVARRCVGREESSNTVIDKIKDEIENDMVRMAEERLFTNGASVKNVDGVRESSWRTSSLINVYNLRR